MSQWWFKFQPSSWRSAPELRMCSLAARGLWIDMLCLMHEAEPRGHLLVNGVEVSPKQLAAMSSVPLKQCLALLEELEDAGVFSRENGVIFSRRMVDKTEYNEFVNMRPCPEVWSKKLGHQFSREIILHVPTAVSAADALSATIYFQFRAVEAMIMIT